MQKKWGWNITWILQSKAYQCDRCSEIYHIPGQLYQEHYDIKTDHSKEVAASWDKAAEKEEKNMRRQPKRY